MKHIITLLSLSLLLGSCSKDDCGRRTDDTQTPVIFSPEMIDSQETRAAKTTWTQNDKIAIFSDIAVKKNGQTSTGSITYTRGATAVWTAPSADESWYWANAVDQHNFYAYYPAGTATAYTAVEIPDISGQDGTKSVETLKGENDFMRGVSTASKGDDMVARLQMFRVFSIINLNVQLQDKAFANNAATLVSVAYTSTATMTNATSADKATVDLSNGRVTCTNSASTITLAPSAGFALNATTPVSIPIKVFPHSTTTTINVQFTINGKTSPVQALPITRYVGGYIYNFTVTLSAAAELIATVGDPTIVDWTSNNSGSISPVIPN